MFPLFCFWLMWSMWWSFFNLNCLPIVGKEGGYWPAANTDPSLFPFLVILIKYKEETAFLLKRRDHEQVLPRQHWCWYWDAKCSCHILTVNWSGLMILKLGTSPITEELGHLLPLQFLSCKQLAIILVHWSLKAGKVGVIRHFGFPQLHGAALGLHFCTVPPFTCSSLLSWFSACWRRFYFCAKAVWYLLATLLWKIWGGGGK